MNTHRIFSQLAFSLLTVIALLAGTSVVQADTIAGVTIEDVSSELVVDFDRGAIRLVDGSGLVGNQHDNTPDGSMWLTTGTGCCGGNPATEPNGPGRGIVTFDLGANYNLNSTHVWNYNEVNLPTRGANQVEILTADTDVAPVFTSLSTVNLTQAAGTVGYTGETLPLIASNVRLVQFNILSSHGGDNGFSGLSEVQFDGVRIPEPSTFVLVTIALLGLLGWGWRRRR